MATLRPGGTRVTFPTVKGRRMSNDAELRERAAKVVPGGMYGHLNAALHGPAYPQFFDVVEPDPTTPAPRDDTSAVLHEFVATR